MLEISHDTTRITQSLPFACSQYVHYDYYYNADIKTYIRTNKSINVKYR